MAGGNLILTGHDDDFHCFFNGGASQACAQLGAMTSFARNSNALPVLVIDTPNPSGGALQLDVSMTTLGVPHTTVAPGSVTAGMFNNSVL